MLKLLFHGASTKVLLWETKITLIKQVYIFASRRRKKVRKRLCDFLLASVAPGPVHVFFFPLQWPFLTELVLGLYLNDKE